MCVDVYIYIFTYIYIYISIIYPYIYTLPITIKINKCMSLHMYFYNACSECHFAHGLGICEVLWSQTLLPTS